MKNELVIEQLTQIADLLEIIGESVYKIRAYRKAVDSLQQTAEDIEIIVQEDRVKALPGIGDAIGDKIKEIVVLGRTTYLDKLTQQIPVEVTSLMRVEGIGGKTAGRLYKELGIKSITGLEEAIENGLLAELSGFTENKIAKIARALTFVKSERRPLFKIIPIALNLKKFLEGIDLIQSVEIGGSIRRRKSTIRDIDLHAIGKEEDFEQIMDIFSQMDDVEDIVVKGPLKTTVKLTSGINVDLRVLEEQSNGSGLIHSTGSRNHTVKLRTITDRNNMLLNEYGLFDEKGEKLIASKTETEVYKAMGMSYIPPDLREDRGEIELAQKHSLPDLINLEDIKGDFHVHTHWSDGKSDIDEMASAANERNYEYIIITDHFGKNPIYKPMNAEKLTKQRKAIEQIAKNSPIEVLQGVECDILKDGSLSISNKLMKDLDFVIASIHSIFDMPEEEMTSRIITAMDNEFVNGIGHPTGRQLDKRGGYSINFSKIIEKCIETKTFLEINAYPNRLDVDDNVVFDFKNKIEFFIGTDSHSHQQLKNMGYGLNIARRAWCEKKNILNTLTSKELLRKLA
ncbi:MAG: DNA polymerase/3'-5' exonuclease PolX [Candidatus Heimdallarchaeota archaeon]